jgi:hypothetical protein
MGRHVSIKIAAALAVAAALVVSTVGTATAAGVAAAPAPSAAASADANRGGGGGGITPNSKLLGFLQVDDKANKVVVTLRGVGTQVYDCAADGSKYVFREPVATLSPLGGDRRIVGIHGKGPIWVNLDGSKVAGTVVAPPAEAPPNPAGASNVAWLKLSAASEPQGGVFSNLTFIQRLDTKGGVAPAGSCAKGPKSIAVDYSANYVFWTKK